MPNRMIADVIERRLSELGSPAALGTGVGGCSEAERSYSGRLLHHLARALSAFALLQEIDNVVEALFGSERSQLAPKRGR
jgi:hypothetical protein